MGIIRNFLYGLISGLSEFLPISSFGHQAVLRDLFGVSHRDPLLDLFVHLAVLVAAIVSCRHTLDGFRKDFRTASRRGRVRKSPASIQRTYELRLLITAAIPMLAMLIFGGNRNDLNPLWLCVCFIINGIILFIPDYLLQSNKDAGKMAGLDGILIGLFAGLSVIPGFSRIGGGISAAVARGADKNQAYNWLLMLSIPALVILCFFDLIAIFAATNITFGIISAVSYILAAVGAFAAGYLAIMLMRFLTIHMGNSGFAYYCWGVSMLIFILYLIA